MQHPHLFSSQQVLSSIASVKHDPANFSQSKEEEEGGRVGARIFQLMKEQLDIALSALRRQMNHIIRQQAQEIKTLQGLLTRNGTVITKQAQIIRQLVHEKSLESSQVKGKSPGKISLTQKRVHMKSVSPGKIEGDREKLEKKIKAAELGLNELFKELKKQ